jgi:hypothetical protein
MLPGSECGLNSICYLDQCVSINDLDPSVLNIEYETEILDLSTHCTSGHGPSDLTASNHDPRNEVKCINWETDFLCEQSQKCPKSDDSSVRGLYTRHICCEKCAPKSHSVIAAFSRARINGRSSLFISIIWIILLFNNFEH